MSDSGPGFCSLRTAALALSTLVAVCVGGEQAFGQLDSWVSHTPFRSVRSITGSDTAIWAATSGGVFSYDTQSGEINTLTTTEGSYGIDAVAIDYDPVRDAVWVGYSDGVLDRIDVETRSIETFLDISRASQFQSRMINRLHVVGDTILVATDFGLVLFDPVRLEVIDSYTNLGALNPATPVNDAMIAPLPDGRRGIWVATQSGLVSADLNAVNLREPSEWTVESGFPVDEMLSLVFFGQRIHVGTEVDTYSRADDGSWTRLNLAGGPIFDMIVWNDQLVAVEQFSLLFRSSEGVRSRVFVGYQGDGLTISYSTPRSVAEGPSGELWTGDLGEGVLGLAGIEPSTTERFWSERAVVPDGPFFGLFTDLVFDDDGALWASGTRGTGTGFYKYDGQTWSAYTERFVPELEGRATYDFIDYAESGSVWAGSEGFALAEVTTDDEVLIYDESNSTLKPAAGTDGYVRVRGIASEPNGSLWVVNQFSPTPLNHYGPDGTWTALQALRGDGIPSTFEYDKVFVDDFGQKWILPFRGLGMIVWDSGDSPTDAADDRVKYLRGRGSGGRGLPDENVTAWAEDRTGRVWIGTQRGLGVYFVPSLVISDDPNAYEAVWPISEDRSGFLLRDLFVNDLAVDAADRKWIASTTGAWLIDPEGMVVLKHFTAENSPLFSDEVVAVAVDNRTGRVYFATDRGLLSYQDDPIEPVDDAEDLFIFPNPVVAGPDGTLPTISIEGLVAETDIRIATADGSVVSVIDGRGGRVRWDGRNQNGEFVPSGVYIVMARGLNDEGVAYGKIAVIR